MGWVAGGIMIIMGQRGRHLLARKTMDFMVLKVFGVIIPYTSAGSHDFSPETYTHYC